MNTLNDTFSVIDLRHQTNKVIKTALNNKIIYLIKRSKPTVAVVDLDYLKALQEAYEEYLDILKFNQTIKLKKISLEEHQKQYKKINEDFSFF